MSFPFRLSGLSALALLAATPALAQESDGVILWDRHIAARISQVDRDRTCPDNAYRADRRACREPGLNLSFGERARELSALDEFVLFVDETRRLEANRRLGEGARLDFDAELQTLTPDEAEVEITLKILF